jgi:2-aminoadipate transaminase
MNLWVTLPAGCDAEAVLEKARREKVAFLPGRYFAVGNGLKENLRLSFAGLSPQRIELGLRRLAPILESEAAMARQFREPLPEMAMV